MRIALAAVGLSSTIAQVVLMRELVATFYGNELLFGVILAIWMAWVAFGSWGATHLSRLHQLGRKALAGGIVCVAALLPMQIALVRGARAILGITPGALVGFGPAVGVVALSLAPLCLLTGGLFPLGTWLLVEGQHGEQEHLAGQAYTWESIGAVVGGVIFSFIFVHWMDSFQIALLVSAIDLIVAAGLLCFRLSSPRVLLLAVLLVALTGASLPLGRRLHATTLSWQWPDLVFAADSPYGRLVIQARDSQRIFYENGLLAFETQGTFAEEVAHFPLLVHAEPREVLLIGGGVAGGLEEILKHPVAEVTYVELDPLLIEAARAYLPPREAAFLSDPRVTLILSDGRMYVQSTEGTFDIVILNLPEPSTGALNRFYTREFFAEVRAVLSSGGVFALNLPSAENYWSQELTRRNGSVYRTLQDVFPHVLVLPGEHNFFLASDLPLPTLPVRLVDRLTERSIQTRWVTPSYIEYVLTTDRFSEVNRMLEETATDVRFNSDLSPICYYYDLTLWFSRFYPWLRGVVESTSTVSLWWVAVPLILLVLLLRWQCRWTIPFAIATVALAEMMLEVVILFAFQVLHGTVYTRVSLIVTAFMAGLALGSALGQRLSRDSEKIKGRLIAVQVLVGVYGALLPLVFSLPMSISILVFIWLALVAGGLTGTAFPLALRLMQKSAGRTASVLVGTLYGADLVGGCLGALLGAVLLVPLLGIPQTCVAVALVGLAGLAVLV